jgi:MSHA biogenesis protein MshP
LPVALFVITVLALIVVSMAQQQEITGVAISQQILSQRAFYAAESGAQAAVTEALYGGGGCGSVPGSLSFAQSGLNSCSASLSCSSVQADIEGGPALETVYTLVSVGQCGAGTEVASRTVEVRVR